MYSINRKEGEMMIKLIDTVKEVSQACGLKHITPKSEINYIIHDVTKLIEPKKITVSLN